jgi:hypothetical protein
VRTKRNVLFRHISSNPAHPDHQVGATSAISAVSPQGEFRSMVQESMFTGVVFKRFLRIGAKRPSFLIVDGHPKHKSKLVRSYVESTNGKIKSFLPASVFAAPEP